MPKLVRTIDYYTCEYKCGRKAGEKHVIAKHEENCVCNPKNKACRICTNCRFENSFLICSTKELYYKVEKRALSSDTNVYNKNMEIVWEVKKESNDLDLEKWNEIQVHNNNRPFPTKNCDSFKLGKKVY